MPSEMVIEMAQDKTTKRTVRYADASGSHNMYLSKEEVAAMGHPTKIKATLEPLPD